MPNYYTTPTALNPIKYRAWLEHCAAIGTNPLPQHSVTPNGCWALVKPVKPTASGYIQITRRINGKMYRLNLHTLSLLYENAPGVYAAIDAIQADGVSRAMACHKPICGGNKACFNPAHLRLDDDAGNKRDMVRDGNQVRGEAVGGAKLTDAQVNAIRADAANGAMQVSLAREYGVSEALISLIVNRKSRAHSDGRLL